MFVYRSAGNAARSKHVGVALCWSAIMLLVGAFAFYQLAGVEEWAAVVVVALLIWLPFWLLRRGMGVRVLDYGQDSVLLLFRSPEYAQHFAAANGMIGYRAKD